MAKDSSFPKDSYYAYKNILTTTGTIGASIVASNIVTPIARNYIASKVQKRYLDKNQTGYEPNMKI